MPDHIRGNRDARLVLEEYADFECPFCAMAYPYVKDAVYRFRNDMAEVFHQFPLMELHPHALHAAIAAEAAGKQGKFWQMHDMLFENNKRLDDASLMSYAQAVGLDLERFRRDFEDPATEERVLKSREEGEERGVQGTPAFFLNGAQLQLESYDELEQIIAEAVRAIAAR